MNDVVMDLANEAFKDKEFRNQMIEKTKKAILQEIDSTRVRGQIGHSLSSWIEDGLADVDATVLTKAVENLLTDFVTRKFS